MNLGGSSEWPKAVFREGAEGSPCLINLIMPSIFKLIVKSMQITGDVIDLAAKRAQDSGQTNDQCKCRAETLRGVLI
jgi:hypothetical protein